MLPVRVDPYSDFHPVDVDKRHFGTQRQLEAGLEREEVVPVKIQVLQEKDEALKDVFDKAKS